VSRPSTSFGLSLSKPLLSQAFAWGGSFHWREAAPESARRAGHFHLLAQMKVTKAKGLSHLFFTLRPEGAVDDGLLTQTSSASDESSSSHPSAHRFARERKERSAATFPALMSNCSGERGNAPSYSARSATSFVSLLGPVWRRRRGLGLRAGARSAHQQLTSCECLSAAAGGASSRTTALKTEHRREVPAKQEPPQSGRLFLLTWRFQD
jgi:hypothetical protein